MANIVLDFLHNYQTGERRESEPANAYQYDEGHVLEAVLPEVITSAEIHYWIRGMEEADAYTPTSITPNEDSSCTVLGNIPNSYFETNGELRIYIVVTDGTASITTYEGKLHICQRSMPDDYVDDDPDNEATRVLVEAQEAAQTATEQAEAAAASAEQAAESARTLTLDTTLTQSGQGADAKAAGDAINDLKDDLQAVQTEVAATLITDTASGSIASFPDGADNVPVKSLTVAVEPVQDLHGQANPYPAGGGVNILDADGYSETTETGTNKTIIVNKPVYLEANQAYTFSCRQVGNAGTVTRNLIAVAEGSSTTILAYEQSNTGTAHVHTVTYTPSTSGYYRPAYWAHTLQNAVTLDQWQVEKGSAFTSYAPYSNICPISGHTQAKVTRTGKNLLNEALIQQGNFVSNTNTSNCKALNVSITGGQTYTWSQNVAIAGRYIRFADADGIERDESTRISTYNTSTYTFTAPSWASVANMLWYSTTDITPADVKAMQPQLEVGSIATAYEPYNGQTYTISLDGTRYGGTLNVETGVLTVDRALVTITGDSITSIGTTSTGVKYIGGSLSPAGTSVNGISNQYTCVNSVVPQGGTGIRGAGNGWYIYDDRFTDMETAKSLLNANPVQMVYTLAESITLTLTAQEVTTLLGQNNVWADCGNVSVNYRADTKLYIQKVINS